MKDLGNFLAERRVAAGYRSQVEMSSVLGKGSSWLSRLERGAAKELPPPEDVALLAKTLHVSQAEIIAAAGYDVETGKEDESPGVAALRPILESSDLTKDQIDTLRRIVLATLNRPPYQP